MSEEASQKAAQQNLVPYVPYSDEDVRRMPGGDLHNGRRGFPFPQLGDHEPEGWELTGDDFFVDSSGFGQEGEPALTVRQFNVALRQMIEDSDETLAFAIGDVGQFQLYVNVYRRTN
jgi:hypothetical protein